MLRDCSTGEFVGVEETSTYLDDRSVPEYHQQAGVAMISGAAEGIEAYGRRIAEAVERKVRLARSGYDHNIPLMLSVYANEYVTIHMTEEHWDAVVRTHEAVFDDMSPFSEVVIWPLVNGGALRVRPS
jgi:hypothetical protein